MTGATAVRLPADGVVLEGDLDLPVEPLGVVLFAHGSGSSRASPRNRSVAARLRGHRLGTLLFDLLTVEEALDRANVFDVALLGSRLVEATSWLRKAAPGLPVAYFGASTGAAAALRAAAEVEPPVAAVVSRGGRPDLAGDLLPHVRTPTLLIVGGADPVVLDLNRRAAALLGGERRLEVVPGAGHLFEEPGALERVADLAADWLTEHLRAVPASDGS